MIKYPFAQPVTFIFFRAGRVALLLCALGFAVFAAIKNIPHPMIDDETFQSISILWGISMTILVLATMWLAVMPDKIEALFTRRAYYEATLYHLLMQVNKRTVPQEVKVTLFEAYLAYLRTQYQLDPAEHLDHIPDVEADELRRICADLITKEKMELAESLKEGLTGVDIQREGMDIERLEAMNHVLNERFKGSVLPQTSAGSAFVGMTTEA